MARHQVWLGHEQEPQSAQRRITGCKAARKGSWGLRRGVQKRREPQKGSPSPAAHSAQISAGPFPAHVWGNSKGPGGGTSRSSKGLRRPELPPNTGMVPEQTDWS